MAQTVLLKRSSVAGNVPGSSDLSLGEIAVNTADGAVYIKKGNNDIVAVADNDILHINTTNSRVGIGTTSPGTLLDIYQDAEAWLRITGGATDINGIRLGTGSGSRQNAFYRSRDTDLLTIRAGIDDSDIQIIAGGSSNEIMRFDGTNSRVGIGTNAPGQKLHVSGTVEVNGNIYFDGSTTGSSNISYGTGTTQPTVAFWGEDHASYPGQVHIVGRSDNAAANSGEISFWDYTGSSWNQNMVINKDGKVGIGYSSPNNKLTVSGASDGINIIGTSSYIRWNSGDMMIRNEGSYAMGFHTYDGSASMVERMRIDSSGNVGIGTNSPDHLLELSAPMGSSPTNVIFLRQTGTNTTGGGGAIRFDTSATTDDHTIYYASVEGLRSDAGNGSSELHFKTTMHTTSTTPATRMFIQDDGNVGIGTTTPATPLEVKSTGNTAIRISTDGDASDKPQLQLFRNASAYSQIHYEADGGGNSGLHITDFRNDSNSHIIFNTSGDNERMRIESDGKVGIGTTAPGYRLEVAEDTDGTANLLFLRNSDTTYAQTWAFQSDTAKDLVITGSSGSGGIKLVPGSRGVTISNKLTINDYTFPTSDGSANQVLQTDGSGNLSFGTAAGGGVSISNNVNNRVLTGDGTNANAEANLTFDGSTLGVTGNISSSGVSSFGSGTTVGSVELDGSSIGISEAGILFQPNSAYRCIHPTSMTATAHTSDISLGWSNNKWKDIYLAGYVKADSGYQIGTTTVIDSSRNLTNIGTISSGAISTSGNIDINGNNIIDVNQIDGVGGSGWLDFNMDTDSVYPQSTTDNQTVLGSVTHMNFVGDSNGNGTGGLFYWGYGVNSGDSGTFTQTMSLNRSGNLTTTGAIQGASFSDGTISGITFIDEDSFSTNSATRVPTQQSIKAYVDAQVAGVVDSAPAALNTLNELAAALGDDASFSTTTSTALGNRLRVDTASQGLTGTQQANAITNLGITATKAELNYVDGVTSNIQTQLDGKQASGSYLTSSSGLNASNITSGTINSDRIATGGSGNWWAGNPVKVGTDGVSEVGKYIDFHNTDAGTTDFDTRLYSSGTGQLTINSVGRILTTADEGTGNGLDADTLDGYQSGQFLRSDTADTASGIITYSNTQKFLGNTFWQVSSSDTAIQRADARDDATTRARLHWYGQDSSGTNTNFRHAWYDGSAYVNVDVANQVVSFSGGLSATTVNTGQGANELYAMNQNVRTTDSPTFGGLTSSGQISISKANPVLILNDTTALSNADQVAYISFQDNGTEEAWIGWGSSGNTNFTINNSIGNIVLNGSTTVNAALTATQLNINSGTTNTCATFDSSDDKAFIIIRDDDTDAYLITKDGNFSIGNTSSDYNNFKVNLSNGNVTLDGTVDGRDIATDGTKLDGISAGADVTPSWVPSSDPSYATQSYVGTQISNLVDSAPGTLDTLNELAAALGDDANFSTTVTNSIATKLPLAGGTMTGDLTIPNKIIHSGDTDTYLSFANADDFRIVVGNSTRAAFNTSKIHFNQEGIGQDFQVEGNTDTSLLYVDASADNVGIGTATPAHKLEVNGSFAATTKSFDIEHPSKEGMRLKHGVVEGPEHSVYVRGKSKEKVILLPDYWVDLVHEDSITVQLTAIGGGQNLYVEDIKDNKVYVNGENYFYYIQAERKDVERFEVEYGNSI